ncbi:hypothetical protein LX36DRAFT_307720 [Colletotrichum falcatum]|nr:hypothetical protein LX36DRAFT_307720 [Colletotrichum falcatum]
MATLRMSFDGLLTLILHTRQALLCLAVSPAVETTTLKIWCLSTFGYQATTITHASFLRYAVPAMPAFVHWSGTVSKITPAGFRPKCRNLDGAR